MHEQMTISDEQIIQAPERSLRMLKKASVKPDQVLLSVVIPNYNTADYIVPAVESVLRQTFSQLEVIVIDDGSSDNSIQRISSISDPRLTCAVQENRGLAGARNSGLLLARGACVGFLDSDDIWFPEKAERQMALLDADPGIGFTYSFSEYLLEDGTPSGQFLTSRLQSPTPMDLVFRNHVGNGSTPIIRMTCFGTVGYFDEDLKYCEDIEMWIRISAYSGYRLHCIPEALTGYRVRSGSMSSTVQRMIPDAEVAVERFRTLLPGISVAASNRAFAQILRVASRKAFSSGDTEGSKALLLKAWQRSPALPFYDVKALTLLALHLLSYLFPNRVAGLVFSLIHAIRRLVFRWACLSRPTKI